MTQQIISSLTRCGLIATILAGSALLQTAAAQTSTESSSLRSSVYVPIVASAPFSIVAPVSRNAGLSGKSCYDLCRDAGYNVLACLIGCSFPKVGPLLADASVLRKAASITNRCADISEIVVQECNNNPGCVRGLSGKPGDVPVPHI
jgi:hypothetical protein